ncbi:hypothetical protein H4R19_001605 [Coemansia spiralis]|nr:hypothetical protein H4R19_001605 [Coemansia spiralis]
MRMVEESWTEERLLQQVRTAHPEFSVCKPELDAMMRALSWYHGGDGRYAPKRSFGRTSDHDCTERSLGLKLLLGTLPVMQRQTAWYPEAYPEPEMRTCPKGHVRDALVETREHFLECSIGDARPIRPRGNGRADLWIWDYITERRTYAGITTGDSVAAERALRPGVGEDDENPPPTAGGRRLAQRAYRLMKKQLALLGGAETDAGGGGSTCIIFK